MKRTLQFIVAMLAVLVAAGVLVTAATNAVFVVTPDSPNFDGNNTAGVTLDAAPGYSYGSMKSNGIGKTDMIFTPESLFGGREVTLGEIDNLSYWTKKGDTHAANPADWYVTLYTKPFPGDVSSATWYGSRIGAEPYFSANLVETPGTWTQWSTEDISNVLRFFESTAGAPGATFGSYADPDWATFVNGNSLGTAVSYASQPIGSIRLQTGSAWAAGFQGQVDGLRIELTDGSVANINLEPFLVATDRGACKKDGWMTLYRPNHTPFGNQGDCVSFVNGQ